MIQVQWGLSKQPGRPRRRSTWRTTSPVMWRQARHTFCTFYIWITVQSKLQLESPLEQLTQPRRVHNWMECTQDECHFDGVLWQPRAVSDALTADAINSVGCIGSGGCAPRVANVFVAFKFISDRSTRLVMRNGACWSHLKTLKTQTHSDGWRPGHRKYILHKAVLWSLLRMVCTYSVSRVCWILWNFNSFIPEKNGSCSLYDLSSIYLS